MNIATVLNENFIIKQFDTKPVFKIGLAYDDDEVLDLTGATVTLYVADSKGLVATKEMNILEEEGNVVSFQLDDGDIANAGTFDVEIVVVYEDGKRETFPDTSYLKLKVMQNLANRGS